MSFIYFHYYNQVRWINILCNLFSLIITFIGLLAFVIPTTLFVVNALLNLCYIIYIYIYTHVLIVLFHFIWLRDASLSINIDENTFICKNRNHVRGGGVGMYIADSHNYFIRDDLTLDSEICDSILIEIVQEKRKNIIVDVVYKPPNIQTDIFSEALDIVFNKITSDKKMCYVMCDFNID